MTVRNNCITGFDPNANPDYIPGPAEFTENDPFLPAPAIDAIATALINECPEFDHLIEYQIRYFWLEKARKAQERVILGEAAKPAGLLRHVIDADFVVIIAANTARAMTNLQVEALVYHELCHLQAKFDEKTGENRAILRGHDTEMFRAEIENYGLWKADLQWAAKAFEQLSMSFAGSSRGKAAAK